MMRFTLRWARGVLPLAWILLALSLWAQPQLTTIQDTIYRGDGQLFDGYAMITWQSFLAADFSAIAANSKTVPIINGVINVTLVPTTTAGTGAYFFVRLVSNGRVQSTEYWGVPPSSVTLKLRDVRLTGPPIAGQVSSPPGAAGPVEIPDVIGLADELAARPKKGLTYGPSRAVVVNSSGDLAPPLGDPTDCVRVDGTAGPCGSGSVGPGFVDNETPAGLVNGFNTVFTLANAPDPGSSLAVYRNGLWQANSADYTATGNTITFFAPSAPQTGDTIRASYRLTGVGGQSGGQSGGLAAGGALTGFYPSPSIAPGAIANQHVSDSAGIVESKLALGYPTHSNANDPTSEQKVALAGTGGTPSSTNRFVTDQDPRMSNSRAPSAHALLSGAHFDTNPASASRGDLIVGIGTSPALWTRLPLGAPNRCLISNGFDAVWNSCLYTGFPVGSIPFVDSQGNLAFSNARLFWDNSNRRLSVGNNTPGATLTVHDASASTGVTAVTVRAGDAQSSTALQRWQDAAGVDLAKVDFDGALMASAVRSTSTSAHAAWQETGTTSDPSSPSNGNTWLNTTEGSRKSFEGGQKHAMLQILCSAAGIASNATTMTSLGKCHIPAGLIRTGDRFEVRFTLSHEGGATSFSYSVNWGTEILASRSASGSETISLGNIDALPDGSNLRWTWQSWGSGSAVLAGASTSASIPSGAIDVDVLGQMTTTTGDTVTLRNLTVLRYPAIANP